VLEITTDIRRLIDLALTEDQVYNDVTTNLLVPPEAQGVAVFRAKAAGVVAGIGLALEVFKQIDPAVETRALIKDGQSIKPSDVLGRATGRVGVLLRGERTALNFLQRLSGIATETSKYVKAVKGTKAQIVDTRKTAPGFRYLDKYAVRAGGGRNHRMHLADGVLIKDNHIEMARKRGMGLSKLLATALSKAPHTLKVEVEVTGVAEAEEAVKAGAHIIMLDNMSLEEMARAVKAINGRALVEASGGVTLETVRQVAETGVDIISVGALTHSVRALDISLDIEG
jgi:nicotinate-nucleotide pyrophosphorylase (carboxylating)